MKLTIIDRKKEINIFHMKNGGEKIFRNVKKSIIPIADYSNLYNEKIYEETREKDLILFWTRLSSTIPILNETGRVEHDRLLGTPEEIHNILLIDDPVAIWKRGGYEMKMLCEGLWKTFANEYLGQTNLLQSFSNKTTFILFSSLQDKEYCDRISNEIGINLIQPYSIDVMEDPKTYSLLDTKARRLYSEIWFR